MFSQQLAALRKIYRAILFDFSYKLYIPWCLHISLLYNESLLWLLTFINKMYNICPGPRKCNILDNHFIKYISSLPYYSWKVNDHPNHELAAQEYLILIKYNKYRKNYSVLYLHAVIYFIFLKVQKN